MVTVYSIYDYGATWVDLHIQNDHAYTRVFIRTADSSWESDTKKFATQKSDVYYPIEKLRPSTDYVVNVGWSDESSTGDVTWIGALTFTTLEEGEDDPPLTDPLFSVEANIKNKTITAFVDETAGYSYFKYSLHYINDSGVSEQLEATDYISSTEHIFTTELNTARQYIVWFSWSETTTGVGNAYGMYVVLEEPYITILDTGTSSIKVCVDNLDKNYNQGLRIAFWEFISADGGASHEGEAEIGANTTSGGTYTATGLRPNTEYEVRCLIGYDVDGTGNYAFVELDPVTDVWTKEGNPEYVLKYYNYDELHGAITVGNSNELLVIANDGEPLPVNQYEMHCFSVSFDHDCMILFYSVAEEKDLDLDGYISTEIDFNAQTGTATETDEYAEDAASGTKYDSNCNSFDFGMPFHAKANQRYYFWWSIVAVDAIDGHATFYIKKYDGSVTIQPWTWDYKNGPYATARQTTTARDALRNRGKTTDFAYEVWNDLIAKAREVRGVWLTDGGNYLDYYDIRITPYGDKTLTANMFNSLKYNIEYGGYDAGFPDVQKGDRVKGSYFFALTDKLNEHIADMS